MPAQWEMLNLENEDRVSRDEIGFGNYSILQDRKYFSYGIDAVLLADFAASFIKAAYGEARSEQQKATSEQQNRRVSRVSGDNRKSGSIAVDLGTGTGVIPIILAHKTDLDKIIGIDIEEYFVHLAKKSAAENGLGDRVFYKVGDVRNVDSLNFSEAEGFGNREESVKGGARCDFVTCNPPYFKADASIPSKNSINDAARREVKGGLEDFCMFASKLLERGGEFFLVHRPERLIDIAGVLRNAKLEPRDIRFVSSRMGEEPKFVLIRSIKDGGRNLRFMKPLAIYDEDGSYTRDILKIYERDF